MIRTSKTFNQYPQAIAMIFAVVVFGLVVIHVFASSVVGDLNNDGVVNVFDLSIILSDWGSSNASADLNHDGTVNVFDLSTLLSHWGQTGTTSTPTPTPSATPTHTPTPTPTSTPVGQSCTNPQFTSSDAEGTWSTADGYLVQNDAWNGGHGPQTIYACAANNFYVVSNQVSKGGAVETYPDVGRLFDSPKAISTYSTITSSFSESIPALGEWDAAYDIWTNNWSNEIMIWNNTHAHPEIPPSGSVAVTIDGIAYHEWHDGSDYVAMMRDTPVTSGTVNILNIFKWLETQGLMKPSDTLKELEYGVEISATESSAGVQGPETFQINGWSLTAN